MKYMMLVCSSDSAEVMPENGKGMATGTAVWAAEMDERRIRLDGNRLRPAEDATTVRVRNGEIKVADGPHITAGERIAAYDIIECADLDEAIEVASKHPMAYFGAIDIRPFW